MGEARAEGTRGVAGGSELLPRPGRGRRRAGGVEAVAAVAAAGGAEAVAAVAVAGGAEVMAAMAAAAETAAGADTAKISIHTNDNRGPHRPFTDRKVSIHALRSSLYERLHIKMMRDLANAPSSGEDENAASPSDTDSCACRVPGPSPRVLTQCSQSQRC